VQTHQIAIVCPRELFLLQFLSTSQRYRAVASESVVDLKLHPHHQDFSFPGKFAFTATLGFSCCRLISDRFSIDYRPECSIPDLHCLNLVFDLTPFTGNLKFSSRFDRWIFYFPAMTTRSSTGRGRGRGRSTASPADRSRSTTSPAPLNLEKEWEVSESTEASLTKLVEAGVLPPKAMVGWRPPTGETFPSPNTGEVVVFEDYFFRGFGLPAIPFFRDFLVLMGLSLCNLPPNTILHFSTYIYLCECWLGIEPHFNLFRHFFRLVRRGGNGSRIVGSVYLKLRDDRQGEYIPMPLSSNIPGWQKRWFYMQEQDLATPLSASTSHLPTPTTEWTLEPHGSGDLAEIAELKKMIADSGVEGPHVAKLFMERRCQPLKARIHSGFEYSGLDDPTREVRSHLATNDVDRRLAKLFEMGKLQSTHPARAAYSRSHPRPEVIMFLI
jgi:hypothetical protein